MSNSITFAGQTTPQMSELDTMFRQVGVVAPIPCTVAGTNALTLTPLSYALSFTAYANYMQFSGVVSGGNSGAVTVQVGSLGVLPAYKDGTTGPVAFTGGELTAGNMFSARYDVALNAGNGGFHVATGTTIIGGTISGVNALLALFGTVASVGGVSLTSTLLTGTSLTVQAQGLQVGTTVTTITRMLSALATVAFSITPANAVQDQNVVLTGAQVRDVITLGLGVAPAGAGFTGFCGTLGTVTVRLVNPSTVTLGAATMTLRAMAQGMNP